MLGWSPRLNAVLQNYRVENLLLLGHSPFGLEVTLILRALRPVGRAPRPPFIQALGHQGQLININNTTNLTIQYNICLFLHVVIYYFRINL